jgi:membrane protein YqaA with SNARE-associated domain
MTTHSIDRTIEGKVGSSQVEPTVYTPVSAVANLRRSARIAAALGVVAIVLCSLAGHPLLGVFGLVGLALGAGNNLLLQQAVRRFALDSAADKKKLRQGVMVRLGSITLLAIGVAILVRPDGFGVFAGLAVFQVLMLVGAAVPVFRSLRPTS